MAKREKTLWDMADKYARMLLDHYENDMTKEQQESFDKWLDDLKKRGF